MVGVTNITYPAIWTRATLCSMTKAVFCWVMITGGGVGGGDQHYIPSHLDKGYTLQHDQSCILLGHDHRWWGGWGVTNITYPAIWTRATLCSMTKAVFYWVMITGGGVGGGDDQHYIPSHLDKGYTLQHDQSCILLGHDHRWWGGWGVTNITYPAIWTRATLCSMTKAVFCWVMITGGGVGGG